MTTSIDRAAERPVRKSIRVKTTVERAFHVFTDEFDTWWPRSHHIGKSPMKKAIVEARAGGRCYTEQEDGTECDWGRVLVSGSSSPPGGRVAHHRRLAVRT